MLRKPLIAQMKRLLHWRMKWPSLTFNTGSCLWILSRRLLQKLPQKRVTVPNRKRCSRVPTTWTSQTGSVTPRSPRLVVQPQGVSLPPPAPAPASVQNDDASKRCRVAAAFSHDSVLKAAENGTIFSTGRCTAHLWFVFNLYGMDVPANCVPLESESSEYPDHWPQDTRVFFTHVNTVGRWFRDADPDRCHKGKRKKGKKAKTKKESFVFFLTVRSQQERKLLFNSACPTGVLQRQIVVDLQSFFVVARSLSGEAFLMNPAGALLESTPHDDRSSTGTASCCRFCGQETPSGTPSLLARFAAWKPCSVFVHDQLGHSLVVIMMNVVLRKELMVLAPLESYVTPLEELRLFLRLQMRTRESLACLR